MKMLISKFALNYFCLFKIYKIIHVNILYILIFMYLFCVL